jgi:hypothetical protein
MVTFKTWIVKCENNLEL